VFDPKGDFMMGDWWDMDQTQKNEIKRINAGHANEEEAFERLLDGLLQMPIGQATTPDCSWCNWRRGDSPRNLKFCGFHQAMRNRLRGGG
jgi:hypothetical protein